jgi:hypothetical protein
LFLKTNKKKELPCVQAIPFLGIYAKGLKEAFEEVFVHLYHTSIIRAKKWKQYKYPMIKWMN